METKKKYNPTITRLFENEKFGAGALKSQAISPTDFKIVQEHLQVGSSLVLRKGPTKNKNGGDTFFLEILPPFEGSKTYTKRASNEDI